MNKVDTKASQLINNYLKLQDELNDIQKQFTVHINKFAQNDFIDNRATDNEQVVSQQLELIFDFLRRQAFQNLKTQIERLYASVDIKKGNHIIHYLEMTNKNIFDLKPTENNTKCAYTKQGTSIVNTPSVDDKSHVVAASINEMLQAILDGLEIPYTAIEKTATVPIKHFKINNKDLNKITDNINKKITNSHSYKLSKDEAEDFLTFLKNNNLKIKNSPFDFISLEQAKSKNKMHTDNDNIKAPLVSNAKKTKHQMQEQRYPDHNAYQFIINNFKKRGITIKEMAQEAMDDQQKHGVHVKRVAYEHAIDRVIHKRDNMSLIMLGLTMDDLCTKRMLPEPWQYIMENDLSSFSTDELVGVCLSMPYSGIAVTNFGARDVHKSGLAKRLDEDTKHCNVFADDIVSALIGDAEAIVTHKYSF